MFARNALLAGASVGGGGGGITLVGTANGDGTLTLPTTLENDIVIASGAANSLSPASIAGWTTISSGRAGVGMRTVYKIMGSTPDTTIAFESACAVTAMAFRGVDTSTPLDVTPILTNRTGGSPGPSDPGSITPATDGCAVIITLSLDDYDEAGSLTTPSGFGDTAASDSSSETVTSAMAWLLQDTAAAIDPAAWGVSDDANRCDTIALRPA